MKLLCAYVLISVSAFGANVAPVLNTLPHTESVLTNRLQLAAFISDDGLPSGLLTSVWEQVSGPGTITFDKPTNWCPVATASVDGSYVIKLTAGDGELTTSSNVNVTIWPSPCHLWVRIGGTGSGVVYGTGIYYTNNFHLRYGSSTVITLNATSAPGSTFLGWIGGGTNGTGPAVVTVDQDKTLEAVFELNGIGATTYYVATTGDDADPGTLAQPWKTIDKAARTATAGNKVIITAGLYEEHVTNEISGTPTSPIVFEGQRGTNGEWLTILDPSTNLTANWGLDTSVGSGVYTQSAGYIRTMTIDDKMVGCVWTVDTIGSETWRLTPAITKGTNVLKLASDALVTNTHSFPSRIWDWLGACWITHTNPTLTYLRLADGSNPNGLNIRGSKNSILAIDNEPAFPSIKIQNKSNIVWRNIHLRNGFSGVRMRNASSHDNRVEHCLLTGMTQGLRTDPDTYRNTFNNNTLLTEWYGYYGTGAWDHTNAIRFRNNENIYEWVKYTTSKEQGPNNLRINLNYCGSTNLVYGNRIFKGGGVGIYYLGYVTDPSFATRIWDNHIEGHCSIGLSPTEGTSETIISDNTFVDNNFHIRLQSLNYVGETNRSYRIYRNTFQNPDNAGVDLYFHLGAVLPASYHPYIWIYHNSFSGGTVHLSISGYSYDNGGYTNAFLLNNICSDHPFTEWQIGWITNSWVIGGFDYDLVYPYYKNDSQHVSWFTNRHNLTNGVAEWTNRPGMYFNLGTTSLALNAAIDIHQPFVINGRSLPALPDTLTTANGPGWDIGALEYEPPTTNTYRAALKGKSTFKGKGTFK